MSEIALEQLPLFSIPVAATSPPARRERGDIPAVAADRANAVAEQSEAEAASPVVASRAAAVGDRPGKDRVSASKKVVAPSAAVSGAPALTPTSSLKAAIGFWKEHMQREGLSIHTVKAFGADLALLGKHRGPGTAIGQISTLDLNSFLTWLQHRRGVPCSPKTYARRITSLKSFFRWLGETGVLKADPAKPVIQQSVLSPLPEILSADEIVAARAAAERFRAAEKPDPRPSVLLGLLLQTGIKKGECLGIHTNHIDLSDSEKPFLFVRYASPRHRYKERKLSLAKDWLPVYREYLEQYQPAERLFPYSPRRLEYLLSDVSQAAGLKKQISFDMCRWTCAANELRSGMEPDQIRQKLGVSKIQWRELKAKLEKLASEPI